MNNTGTLQAAGMAAHSSLPQPARYMGRRIREVFASITLLGIAPTTGENGFTAPERGKLEKLASKLGPAKFNILIASTDPRLINATWIIAPERPMDSRILNIPSGSFVDDADMTKKTDDWATRVISEITNLVGSVSSSCAEIHALLGADVRYISALAAELCAELNGGNPAAVSEIHRPRGFEETPETQIFRIIVRAKTPGPLPSPCTCEVFRI